mgnify:CR=1 FL=1
MKEKMPLSINQLIANLRSNSEARIPSKLNKRLSSFKMEDLALLLQAFFEDVILQSGGKAVIGEFTLRKIKAVVVWLCNSPRPGLLLYGNCGLGKTVMLHALHRLLTYPVGAFDVLMYSAERLVELFRDNRDLFYEVRSCRILIVDDVGCEPVRCVIYGTDYAPIRDILSWRYEHRLVTVLSTNLDDKKISSAYGERVWDRICESYDRIVYEGESFRKTGRPE